MAVSPYAQWMLAEEARALLSRLGRVKPFSMLEPMVPAAMVLPAAQHAIESYLIAGRQELRTMVQGFVAWLRGPVAAGASDAEAQRRFTLLRLRFNAALTQFDLFSDVITQRSEYETGVWLSGLDVASTDALTLAGDYYDVPPVICYLDRGAGAAIRRAHTRLPGGGANPVAVIRVPRERMVGAGIASSLVHEIGHQAAALLDLVNVFRPVLQGMQRGGSDREAWVLWERWISEILADFWAIARVGVASTLGLLAVVSLPRAMVFRLSLDDPHPVPWIRVKLSCAIGDALYPHPQWARIAALWESFYPLDAVEPETLRLFSHLQASMPAFVNLLVHHRPPALRGRSLVEVVDTGTRRPVRLAALFSAWSRSPKRMYEAPPTLVFAVLGQARSDGRLTPEAETTVTGKLLMHWALMRTLAASSACAFTGVRAAQTTWLRRQESVSIH